MQMRNNIISAKMAELHKTKRHIQGHIRDFMSEAMLMLSGRLNYKFIYLDLHNNEFKYGPIDLVRSYLNVAID